MQEKWGFDHGRVASNPDRGQSHIFLVNFSDIFAYSLCTHVWDLVEVKLRFLTQKVLLKPYIHIDVFF